MKKAAVVFLIFLFMGVLSADEEKTGKIEIEIKDFRNNDGEARIALFEGKEGFPGEVKKALKTMILEIKNKKASSSFDAIPYGEYAIAVLHDENKDGKLNKNLFGVPKEGYGASNDARGKKGPPKYKDAKFKLGKDVLELEINMTY